MRILQNPRFLLCGALVVVASCGGGKKDDPKLLSLNKIKAPGGLELRDDGDGRVTLKWMGANFEKEFEGYNVYGAKMNNPAEFDRLGLKVGEPVELLDQAGEPREAARTVLALFDYSTANPNALPHAPAPLKAAKPGKFSALPFHARRAANGEEPKLPTCQPDVNDLTREGIACSFLEPGKEKKAAGLVHANGAVSFNLPEALKVGEQYCFLVFAVQDEGKEVSGASSNVACIVPKYAAKGKILINTEGQKVRVDLRALHAACVAQDKCSTVPTKDAGIAEIKADTTTEALAIETYANDPEHMFLVTGKNAFVRMMGTFDGFEDPALALVRPAPKLERRDAGVEQGGGYSLEGQSVVLMKGGMYVIAVGDQARATTTYHYHWLHIPMGATLAPGSEVPFDLRIAKEFDQR